MKTQNSKQNSNKMSKKVLVIEPKRVCTTPADEVEVYNKFRYDMTDVERNLFSQRRHVPSVSYIGIKNVNGRNVYYSVVDSMRGGKFCKWYPKSNFVSFGKRLCSRYQVVRDLKQLGFNWLEHIIDVDSTGYVSSCFTPSVVDKIVNGEITNCDQLIRSYLKTLRLNITPREYIILALLGFSPYTSKYIDNVLELGKKLASMIEKNDDYGSEWSEYKNLLRDYLEQIATIQEGKYSYRWNLNRLRQEHTKITEKIMQLELDSKDQTKVIEISESDGIIPLVSESEVYREGTTMHHCLYTNYWQRIMNCDYFAVRYLKGTEPITIGYRITKEMKSDGFISCSIQKDQQFYKYDRSLSDSDKNLIARDYDLRNYEAMAVLKISNKVNMNRKVEMPNELGF